jgi:hypothetical protein
VDTGASVSGPSEHPVAEAFARHDDARSAIRALQAAGIKPHAISIVTRSHSEARRLEQETGAADDLEDDVQNHPLRDVLAWLGSIESAVVPGFGILWTGNLRQSIGHGGLRRGAITGALVDLGLSADEAAHREEQVFEGQTLVVVHDANDLATARAVLSASKAHE